MEYVNPEGLRLDGRRPNELRMLRCKIGTLERADGSAMFEMGNTKVLAAVFGPREAPSRGKTLHDRAIVTCEYGMAAFSTGERRKRSKGDRRSTEFALVIREAVESVILTELYPRSQIDVFVQVLQADGGARSCCINAAALALADAGIGMRDLVAGCGAGYLDGACLLDPNHQEATGPGPDLSLAMLPNLDKVTLLQMDSKLPQDVFEKVLAAGQDGCRAVGNFMREELIKHTSLLAAFRGDAGV